MSEEKFKEIDDRISCWWCRFWAANGSCLKYAIGKKHAIANGTLHRCPEYSPRLTALKPEIGLCSKCGCQINTELYGKWVPDPRNLELKLLLCNGCHQLIWDRAYKKERKNE